MSMNKLGPCILALLLSLPCSAWSQTAQPFSFSFRSYANNVRVVPPLVGQWQLGTVNLSGSGEFRNGKFTGNVTCNDSPQGTIRLRITDGRYWEDGDVRRLNLAVVITSSTHTARQGCGVGLTGLLQLGDSDGQLPNRQTKDWIGLGRWSGPCGHDHGFNNADPPAGTLPPHQPPRGGSGGGIWANVKIDSKQASNVAGTYRHGSQLVPFGVTSINTTGSGRFTALVREPYTKFGTPKDGSLWADIQGTVSQRGGRTEVAFTKKYRYFQQESVRYVGTYSEREKKITGKWDFPNQPSVSGTFEITGADALVLKTGRQGTSASGSAGGCPGPPACNGIYLLGVCSNPNCPGKRGN